MLEVSDCLELLVIKLKSEGSPLGSYKTILVAECLGPPKRTSPTFNSLYLARILGDYLTFSYKICSFKSFIFEKNSLCILGGCATIPESDLEERPALQEPTTFTNHRHLRKQKTKPGKRKKNVYTAHVFR